jgi:hypothetical protein
MIKRGKIDCHTVVMTEKTFLGNPDRENQAWATFSGNHLIKVSR